MKTAKKMFLIGGLAIVTVAGLGLFGCNNPKQTIRAENEKTYTPEMKIKKEDFRVYTEKKEKKVDLKADEFVLSTDKVSPIGEFTSVKITLKDNEKVTTTVKVKNERKELESFECGFPNKKDVKAVVYSNGELAFEGKGDVQQYDHDKHPWQTSKNKITAISFGKEVSPTYMDYWFENMKDVTYISQIPASVKSVVGMCANCDSLEKVADWSKAKEIDDISKAYFNCKNLREVKDIPEKAINATYAFAGCINLPETPDMSTAKSLKNAIGMFSNCMKLKKASSAPAVELMDMMYDACPELKEMPKISDKVISLGYAFRNCISLTKAETIPASVENLTGCLSNCTNLSGELTIDSNAKEYNEFLFNAAEKTKVELKGKSKILKELAKTNNTKNVDVK